MTEITLNKGGAIQEKEWGASHWAKRTLAVIFCLTLVFTLGLAFTRVIVARVPEQRATLEKLITDRTGLEVRFENVRFAWNLEGTSAIFTRVQLTDPKAGRVRVTAPELRVELDTWDLLRHQQFSLGHVTLASPDIEIIGEVDDTVAPRKAKSRSRVPPRQDESILLRSYLSWAELMPVGHIEVEGARVHLRRRGERVPTQSFTLSEAVISRGSTTFNAYGTMLLSQDVGQSLFVSAKLDGLAVNSRVSGELRVIARRVFLDRLPVAGFAGRGTIDAKFQLREGLLASGSWQASVRELQVNGEGGTRFDHVSLNGRLTRSARDVLLDFTDLQLTRGARLERAPLLSARLRLEPNSLQIAGATVQAERLPFLAAEFLAGLVAPQLARSLPMAPAGWTPTAGELLDVHFESGASGNAPDAWGFSAQVANGELSRDSDHARLGQVHAVLRADAHGLSVKFDPEQQAELRIQSAPRSVTLGGELQVSSQGSGPAWRFATFTAKLGASVVSLAGDWRSGSARAEHLNLTLTQVDRALLGDAWTILEAASPAPRLFSDIGQGSIVEGKLALTPGADGAVDWLRSSGMIAFTELATSGEAAPRLTAGRGTLSFAQGAAQLKLAAGNLEELMLSGAQLDWPQHGVPRLHVALEGDLGSPLIREVLHSQGLDRLGGTVALEADARGERELRQPDLWRVTARVRAGTVPIDAGLPPAENLAGTIRYAARQLRTLELQGNWLGGTVEIESRRTAARAPLTFALRGVADAVPLLNLLGEADASQQVNGQLAWSGSAERGQEIGSWQISLASNLAGVESRLPGPFDKPRMRAMPITAQLSIAPDGIRDFSVDSADLSLHGQLRNGMSVTKFTAHGAAGEFHRPMNGKGTPQLQLDALDLGRAPALLAAASSLLPPRTGMALTVDELRYGDNSLGVVKATIDRRESGVAFSIESRDDAVHQLSAHGQCDGTGHCGADFTADTTQLAALLHDVRLPAEWPTASLHAAGSLGWPAASDDDLARSLTGTFDLATQGTDGEHQLAARGTIADGEILLADVQGTGPAPDQVFRGNGRIGLVARDYDLSVDYERVTLAAAAVPSPARARLSRAWNAVRGAVPETKRVQWHGAWD